MPWPDEQLAADPGAQGDPFLDWYNGAPTAPAEPVAAVPTQDQNAATVDAFLASPTAPHPVDLTAMPPTDPHSDPIDPNAIEMYPPGSPEAAAAGEHQGAVGAMQSAMDPLAMGSSPIPDGPVLHPFDGPVLSPDQSAPALGNGAPFAGPVYPALSHRAHAALYADDPFKNPNDDELNTTMERMAVEDPIAFSAIKQKHETAAANHEAARVMQASEANLQAVKDDVAARQKADAVTQVKSDQLMADAMRLANTKVDPEHWWNSRSTGQKVAGYLTAIVGGLLQGRTGSARNSGMDMIQQAIDQDIDAQKTNIQTQQAGLGFRKGMLADEYARHGDAYQAAETVRVATWQHVINTLQAEQQNFDPRSKTAIDLGTAVQGAVQRQAQAKKAFDDETFKHTLDVTKSAQEQDKINETQRHNMATEAEAAAKAAAKAGKGGAGSGTNPDYTVPTGFFNPFTQQPIMGKREIGGKGEDAKERDKTQASISTYGHVQDYRAQLAAVGAKIDNHKSLGESVWSKFKSTDAAEYDAAREALTVYLTKELGDKLTQGQLEAQAHRIPERANILESRDPGKQIRDAQENADRDFVRDMNLVGIDGAPIVQHAQAMRAPAPAPSGTDAVNAAQQAKATARTPGEKKDADTALDAAKGQLAAENADTAANKDAVYNAQTAHAPKPFSTDGLPPALAAEVQARNEAVDSYAKAIKKHKAAAESPAAKPTKQKGIDDKAKSDHERLVSTNARLLAQSRATVHSSDNDVVNHIVDSLGQHDFGGIPKAKVDAIAKLVGADPSKFGHDANGQVEVGRFVGELGKLDDYKRHKLLEVFFAH